MTTPTDVERPRASTPADVILVARGVTIPASVEQSGTSVLVVTPAAPAHAQQLGVKPGDRVELYWRAGFEERTLPAAIAEIEDGEIPYWHLRATGPTERSQRRKAVRARVGLPVTVVCAGTQLMGETVDLSEAGMRAEVDGWGLPPEPGTPVQVTLTLEKGFVDLRGQIIRHQTRGARWQLSMQFHDVPEKDQDLVRQRVFQALREERAAAAD